VELATDAALRLARSSPPSSHSHLSFLLRPSLLRITSRPSSNHLIACYPKSTFLVNKSHPIRNTPASSSPNTCFPQSLRRPKRHPSTTCRCLVSQQPTLRGYPSAHTASVTACLNLEQLLDCDVALSTRPQLGKDTWKRSTWASQQNTDATPVSSALRTHVNRSRRHHPSLLSANSHAEGPHRIKQCRYQSSRDYRTRIAVR
jgi:hypothetical protein